MPTRLADGFGLKELAYSDTVGDSPRACQSQAVGSPVPPMGIRHPIRFVCPNFGKGCA